MSVCQYSVCGQGGFTQTWPQTGHGSMGWSGHDSCCTFAVAGIEYAIHSDIYCPMDYNTPDKGISHEVITQAQAFITLIHDVL